MFLSRQTLGPLSRLIARVSGYFCPGEPSFFVETAELVFPIVFNLGRPWFIRLGPGGPFDRRQSFIAGLHPGPVAVSCGAGAELLQVDLTPIGAFRLFGGATAELASQTLDLRTVTRFDGEYDAIHDQLAALSDWNARFDLIEAFLKPRFIYASSQQVQESWKLLAQGSTVGETASTIGWSTRHFSSRFRQETGIRPVTALRMLRFQRARSLALRSEYPDWAGVAAGSGYADQAHLIRDFHEFAGETPRSWARGAMPSEPRVAF